MFDRYVSLGRDCEVGFQLKRVRGSQESGFFNWNFTDCRALLSILEADFAGILKEENLSMHAGGAMLRDASHDYFLHHEFDVTLFKTAPDFAEKLARLRAKFNYFVELFRGGASTAGQTAYFLKLCDPANAREAALAIHNALARYHAARPFTLIVLQSQEAKADDWGIVNLHNRYVRRFAPHDDNVDAHLPSWDEIFREFPHREGLKLADY